MKRITALGVVVICMIMTMFSSVLSVSAETIPGTTTVTTSEEVITSTTLIQNYTFSKSATANALSLTASVTAIEVMKKIGFINFEIQRSSSSSGSWTSTSYNVPDQIAEDAISNSIVQYPVSVAGGYYYRICLDFYAKEKGWFFPKTQTFHYESTAIWVPSN